MPPAIRALLERYPLDFLYGSVAADISFAKKYVSEDRHCHNWSVGEEILVSADSERLRAVGYEYLAHLAADTIAHNVFVPRQLLLTSTTQALRHAHWEHRVDLTQARALVVENDHSDADELLDDALSRTIFSFQTNRRVFRGMIRLSGDERWQHIFEQVVANSRFDLPDPLVDRCFVLVLEQVVSYLNGRAYSFATQLDPVGELNLKLEKKVRRRVLSDPLDGPTRSVEGDGRRVLSVSRVFTVKPKKKRLWHERSHTTDQLSRSINSSFTRRGSAWPLDRRMTWPTRNPRTLLSPLR